MSMELEVSIKIRVNDGTEARPAPYLACLLSKLASHPCVAIILREIMRNS